MVQPRRRRSRSHLDEGRHQGSAKEAGSSQNEMLFMRETPCQAPRSSTALNQLPKPPIITGITMKKIMIRPCGSRTL
jgi:hypothetical protein